MPPKSSYLAGSFIGFRNSQGLEARGTLVRLSRQQVVFEVYNPYSIVQLSEVLTETRILRADREVYRGRAVVTGLMNTGLMLIVSASLVDPWSDLQGLKPGEIFRSYVHDFVADWEAANARLIKPFQVAVGNFRNYLQELSRWLEHWETEAGLKDKATAPELVNEFVADVSHEASPRIAQLYAEFEEGAREIPSKVVSFHRAYAQRELHPLMMCSPFMHRAYSKPLGYAGDYEMVRMMLGEPFEGGSSFAKIVNAAALRHDAPSAHRNRIELLVDAITAEAKSASDRGQRLRALNIGCGPSDEVRRIVERDPIAGNIDFHLIDFNAETLAFVHTSLIPHVSEKSPRTRITTEQRSVHDLIKQSVEESKPVADATYDMVYCAGLFDYFRDTTCGFLLQMFHSWTRPGGLVLATNVAPNHSSVASMSLILDWNLELRDERGMLSLAPELQPAKTYVDATGVNVFLTIRK